MFKTCTISQEECNLHIIRHTKAHSEKQYGITFKVSFNLNSIIPLLSFAFIEIITSSISEVRARHQTRQTVEFVTIICNKKSSQTWKDQQAVCTSTEAKLGYWPNNNTAIMYVRQKHGASFPLDLSLRWYQVARSTPLDISHVCTY